MGGSPIPTYRELLRAVAAVDAAMQPHMSAEAAESTRFGFVGTPFHSSSAPRMSLHAYARHLVWHVGYDSHGLAVGLALMARYAVASGRGVTPLAMHRLLGTCIQVGMKATSDDWETNAFVAPVAGMTLAELNALEAVLQDSLAFNVTPTRAEVENLPRSLAALVGSSSKTMAVSMPKVTPPTRALVLSIFGYFAQVSDVSSALARVPDQMMDPRMSITDLMPEAASLPAAAAEVQVVCASSSSGSCDTPPSGRRTSRLFPGASSVPGTAPASPASSVRPTFDGADSFECTSDDDWTPRAATAAGWRSAPSASVETVVRVPHPPPQRTRSAEAPHRPAH